MKRAEPAVHYIRRNFDEAAILAVATKLAFEEDPHYSESELATVAAMQRAHPQAGDSHEALGEWLAGMDPEQVQGVVNNTKGVLHEMEYVRIENEDGDAVHASLYGSTNHPGTDVEFHDTETGETWSAQLKATDHTGYVQAWIDDHPDGEIIVTNELAERLHLTGSGMDNDELTARTEDVVDGLIEASDDGDMLDYLPALSAASIALVVWELWQRYRRGEIPLERFKWLVMKTSGLKAGKIALLSLAMMVPGLNVATGAVLVAKLLFSGADLARMATRAQQAPQRMGI